MPVKSGVHVCLEVDDKPLEEFKVTAETEQRIQCYVPSEEGKRFTVKFKSEGVTHYNLCGYVFLDGAWVAGQIGGRAQHSTIRGGVAQVDGYMTPFLFSRLRTTDNEDEACQDESRIREIGSVRIRMQWVFISGEVPFQSTGPPQHINQPIWERAKKGTGAGHSVTLGNPELVGQLRYMSVQPVPNMPVVEFIFRYGPIDWLRAEGLAPPLPPPPRKTGPPANRSGERVERVITSEEKENNIDNKSRKFVKREISPTLDGSEQSDIDALSPEEEAEYNRLKAKMKARKRLIQTDTNTRGELLRSPPPKRRKSTFKSEPNEDRKPLFPIVRQDDREYIDLTMDD